MFSFKRQGLALAAAAVLGLTSAANAVLLVTVDNPIDGSTPLKVELTFTQNGNNVDLKTQVITDVGSPNTGDLRGVFFNIANNTLIDNLVAAGVGYTEIQFNVSNLGNGATVSPLGPYEVGIEIGSSGIGADDYQLVTFSLSSGAPITLADFSTDPTDYAVRATSVGLPGGSRSGSSKLGGSDVCLDDECEEPCVGPDCGGGNEEPGVPEPVTASLALISAAGLALATRRRRMA